MLPIIPSINKTPRLLTAQSLLKPKIFCEQIIHPIFLVFPEPLPAPFRPARWRGSPGRSRQILRIKPMCGSGAGLQRRSSMAGNPFSAPSHRHKFNLNRWLW